MDDTISRQAVLKLLSTMPPEEAMTKAMLIQSVKQMDAAQPEWKRGTWIPVTNGRGGHECSLCHTYAPSFQTGDEWLTDYCPTCGACMQEVSK